MARRTVGSVRFDPYWKVQTWEARSLSWKDIQLAHHDLESAWRIADVEATRTGKTTRLMEITPSGRTPLYRTGQVAP